MNILLINPPRENEIIGNNPSLIEEKRGFNPPLGILYLAGYLEKYSDYTVSVIDSQVEQLGYGALESRIRAINPDVVGITAMTLTLIDVMKTAELIKKINRDITVVLGGPHVHLFPEETIQFGNVDYLIMGEGEETFKELISCMDDVDKLKKLPGIVFNMNGETINTGVRPNIKNIDELPFPARHLVPYDKYTSLLSKGDVVTTMFTSRGCPYKCAFCDRPHLGKVFRSRSAKNVVDELEECIRMGIEEFLFYDDTFTVNKKRVIDICNDIVERKLNIGWDIRARVDTINEDVIKHLKKAGCQGIHYGIEAGAEKILKALNKGITIDKAKNVFDLTRKYKIPILAYFMIGSPGETKDDIYTTFKVIKKLNPDFVHMTILTPFPGTKIYYEGLEKGIIEKDYWREFARNPSNDFTPPHWGEFFSREELNQLLIEGYQKFYIRPSYVLKSILKVRTLGEFKKKAMAGLKVFGMK
jgi:radical SAM superfamily enzyme YgiQ (UPF0313 family)